MQIFRAITNTANGPVQWYGNNKHSLEMQSIRTSNSSNHYRIDDSVIVAVIVVDIDSVFVVTH